MRTNRRTALNVAWMIAFGMTMISHAQESKEASKSTATPPAKKKVIAIQGADIYTVTRELIRRGTVLIEDDKIQAVGQDISIPEGATVIDARGKYVTPGFIAMDMSGIAISSSGGSGGRGRGGPRPDNSNNSDPADALNPFDRNIKFALGVGITSGCVQIGGSGRGRGRRPRDQRFLGLDPEERMIVDRVTEEMYAFFGEEIFATSEEQGPVCECCGLPILPTEPIVPPTPTPMTARPQVVLKMSYGNLDPMLMKQSPFYHVTASSLSGALNRHNWRQTIQKAQQYLKDLETHELALETGLSSTAPRNPVSAEVLKLVKKETPLRCDANSLDEIKDMIALAKELDYNLVLDGVVEGWLMSDELSDAKVSVVITPRTRRRPQPGRDDSSGSSIELSGLLEKSGVPFAVNALSPSISLNGLAGRDLTSLPLEAAFAIRGGCSEQTALAALTITPARMLGLDDRIGSIEPGKDADLLILDGPPLDYRTYVETAFVNGEISYERKVDRVYPVFER